VTRAEKECATMGPGFRKLVRTLRLKQEREKREKRATKPVAAPGREKEGS
jgi:hypothetical protein